MGDNINKVNAGTSVWRALGLLGLLVFSLSCAEDIPFGPGGVASVRVVPDSIEVPIGEQTALVAAVLDESLALIQGTQTTWSSADPSIAEVDDAGLVRAIAVGTTEVRATNGGVTGAGVVRVILPPTISLSPAAATISAVAGQAPPAPTTVAITNSGGLSISDLSLGDVAFGATASDWLIATINGSSAPATLSLELVPGAVTTAGTHTASVTINSDQASNGPQVVTVNLEMNAGAPDTMVVQGGDAQTAAAGTQVPAMVAVRVADAFGNPVEGVPVSFVVSAGGGSVAGVAPVTDEAGVATLASWTLGPSVGANTIDVTAGALSLTITATGIPGAPAIVLVASGDAQIATVGTPVALPPSVLVTDANNNPVPGASVTFTPGVNSGSVTPSNAVTTDGAGVASLGSWILDLTAGTNTLAVSVPGASSAMFSATGTADVPASIAASAGDGQSATAGATVSIAPEVLVVDQFGNPVAGVNVTYAIGVGAGTVDPSTSVVTGNNGVARVNSWTLGVIAGANTLVATAAAPSITGNPVTFTATGQAGSAGQFSISTQPPTNAQNAVVLVPAPSVQLEDQNGNPTAQAGIPVTVAIASGAGGILSGTLTVNTDGIGLATFTDLVITGATGNYSLGFTGPNISGAVSNPIALGPGAATTIALNDGNNQTATVAANVATAPSVLITDVSGNTILGVQVTFAVTQGGGALTGGNVATDGAGVARVGSWMLGTVAGTNAISATATGLAGSPVVITATGMADTPSASTSAVTTSAASISAGSETATITTTVLDQFGNPVAGASVAIASTGSGNTITQPASTTDGNGQTSGTISSSTVGNKVVTAIVNGATGVTDDASVNVVLGTASNSQSTVVVSTSPITASNGSSQSTVTVTAIDAAGNRLAGLAVAISSDGSNNAFGAANGVTGATGAYSTGFSSTTAESKTVTGTAGGVAITDDATVTVSAAAAASITAQPFAADSARVGTAIVSPPSVLVADQFGNPVSNEAVSFAVTNGGGVVSGTNQITSAAGIATLGSWTVDTVSGGMSGDGTFANTISATATPGTDNVTARAYYTLSTDVQGVWSGSPGCQACHTGFPGTFDISSSAQTFATLVSVSATCEPTASRVVPGSPATSVLMVRLDAGAIGACSTGPMPPGGVLTVAQREIVRAWIRHGAFDN